MFRNALKIAFRGCSAAAALVLGLAAPATRRRIGQCARSRSSCLTPAGGGLDFVARLIADDLTKRLNWTVVVENRGGANGTMVHGGRPPVRSPTATFLHG